MRYRERHRDASGSPDAALHSDVRESGLHVKRHSRLLEVAVRCEQRAGYPSRGAIELAVTVREAPRDDRHARITHLVLSTNHYH
jgi:hypothetical protein